MVGARFHWMRIETDGTFIRVSYFCSRCVSSLAGTRHDTRREDANFLVRFRTWKGRCVRWVAYTSPYVIKHLKQASDSESSLLVHHVSNREQDSGSKPNCVADDTVCGRPNRNIGTWTRLFGVFTHDDFGLYTVTFGRASIATRIS
jgi:hypothetical protein